MKTTLFWTRIFLLAGLVLNFGTVTAQTVPEEMDLYLLIGQSNMAGRGKTDSLSNPDNSGIWFINRDNQWKPAADPLHMDKPSVVGVGPGLVFAQELQARNPSRMIGLIPCAVGGSGIDDWQPGAKHGQTGIFAYDEMLVRVKEATKRGKIKAIIWHQGESNSTEERKIAYEKKLEDFFKRLRKETNTRKVPVILGTLGDFYVAGHPAAADINRIIQNYANTHKNTYFVSAAGLSDLGDKTHFDTRSARELGKRYAEKLTSVIKK